MIGHVKDDHRCCDKLIHEMLMWIEQSKRIEGSEMDGGDETLESSHTRS
jgi:hypothetical protein